ncbi:MAG: M23 family metallopeptidase [Bacteroidia bacterium]|nr:M23 family metallopeptidase [Bacteroidia bacterium]
MEENFLEFAKTYAQGLWISSAIFAALALYRLYLVVKTKAHRKWIFKVKTDFFVYGLKFYFFLGLLAFLADIPVWFLSVAQFRAIAPALPLNILIFVLTWISVQEIILCFTVSDSLINQFIKRILFFLVSIFCSTSFILAAFIVPGTYQFPNDSTLVRLDMPVNGTWMAANAGQEKWVNYHNNFAPQNFAIDLIKLNEEERFFTNSGSDTLDFFSFGDSVFAPTNAVVYKVVDGFPAQVVSKGIDTINPAGNYIELDLGLNQFLFLAHLKAGSIAVNEGDTITVGQFLALAGNSGNTTFPHLHIHIQDRPTINDTLAKGLPFLFNNIQRKRYLNWTRPEFPYLIRNDKFKK